MRWCACAPVHLCPPSSHPNSWGVEGRLRGLGAESSATNGPLALYTLARTLDARLRRVTQILQPDNLPTLDRAQSQECLLALEEIKMLLSELQLIQLRRE